MSIAKCFKCDGTAEADTFEKARALINHAVGLARGIKCGDAYGAVQEIKGTSSVPKVKTIPTITKKVEPTVIESTTTSEKIFTAENVEPKTEKTKTTRKKFKDKKF